MENEKKQVWSESFEALVEENHTYPYIKFFEEVFSIIYDEKLLDKVRDYYAVCK